VLLLLLVLGLVAFAAAALLVAAYLELVSEFLFDFLFEASVGLFEVELALEFERLSAWHSIGRGLTRC